LAVIKVVSILFAKCRGRYAAELIGIFDRGMASSLKNFARLTDPRIERNWEHLLEEILGNGLQDGPRAC
jgi:hypothetical protein